MRYRIFETEKGYVGIAATEKGLTGLSLPCPSERGACWLLGSAVKRAEKTDDLLPDLVRRLTLYFSGEKVSFPDDLDLSAATPFQQKIWQAARRIPFGETRSYGWVASQAGNAKASRAAGQALGNNPIPVIIPCHRVLASDGSLGGFSLGLNMKKKLLALEAGKL